MTRLFQSFFPTPRYLRMPSVGLDISDKSVRFLGLKETPKGIRLGAYADEDIPPGLVEKGTIKDEKRVKEVLRSMKERHKLEFVRVSLPEEHGYLFRLDLEGVSRGEWRDSVLIQLEENVPLSAEEAIFDYEVLDERENGATLQVSVFPRALAESYLRIFKESGLVPLSFEVEAQAIARAVVKKGDGGVRMVVDFGKSRTGISVVQKGVVVFTSTIDIGGYLLTDAISKQFSVASDAAERLKKEEGLSSGRKTKDVSSAIISTISTLKDEINKHFIYWHTHKAKQYPGGGHIESIVLCGGDSNLRGLSDYLAQNLRLPVALADVWQNVASAGEIVPEIPFASSLTYATAIGLALGDFES